MRPLYHPGVEQIGVDTGGHGKYLIPDPRLPRVGGVYPDSVDGRRRARTDAQKAGGRRVVEVEPEEEYTAPNLPGFERHLIHGVKVGQGGDGAYHPGSQLHPKPQP